MRDTLHVQQNGQHEAGWQSRGWPWKRRHRVYCNTCGRVSAWLETLSTIKKAAEGHTRFPLRDIDEIALDINAVEQHEAMVMDTIRRREARRAAKNDGS